MAAPSPLHLAVWDDNTPLLSKLLLQGGPQHLEALDARGNTPLLLAYRMGRTRAARMLLAAGAYSKARTPEGWEAVQVSSLTGNPDLVRTSVVAFLAETNAAFERRLPAVQRALEAMPDFTITMRMELKSWLPLVSLVLPSDTFTMYKRGSSLRIDSTLLGFNNLKWERGNLSLLLWGREAPLPGSVRVLDWDSKSETDARLAFTAPRDQQIQDWVRKLLTQKQKTTDWWSRDAVMRPSLRQGVLARLFGGGGGGGGGAVPRGRSAAAAAAAAAGQEEEAGSVVHQDHPSQVLEDVAGWEGCAVYDLKNLCVRDVARPPIVEALPLASWWRAEYSQEIGVAAAQELHAAETSAAAAAAAAAAATASGSASAAAAAAAPSSASAASASAASAAAAAADLSAQAEPERQLAPLMSILRGIRLGRITESSAGGGAVTLAQLEGMGFGEEGEPARGSGAAVAAVRFEDYFGSQRPAASEAQRAAAAACAGTFAAEALHRAGARAGAAGGAGAVAAPCAVEEAYGEGEGEGEGEGGSEGAGEGARPSAEYVHGDGRLHRPTGAVADSREGSLVTDEKSLDLKVYFAKDFPITVRWRVCEGGALGRCAFVCTFWLAL